MAEEKVQTQEEKVKALQDELRSLLSQAEYLRDQVDAVNAIIDDLYASLEVLDYVSKEGKGKVVLVPIGAGNFIKAKIEDTSTVITSVGGRLNLEIPVEEAKKAIQNRISALEQVRLTLLRKLEEINRKVNEILPRVREEAQ
ncbi:prefoldin subunit alpha [Ignicoccus islandicus DSM 13165]|uniref:Prefoldin subunit alpha n=1 Tax=Ignicoccus islandicus DSM 13165 TaxID=940295 RepID=A0A0U3DWP8_9CREN|nr:prefoldin subunit alpha [Ignicoccus islandicus]ALU11914.1 prefoldin subunit alpha [Ignicoccus islandicus DSM 13165]